MLIIIIIIIIHYIYIALFWFFLSTQSALHCHPPGWCDSSHSAPDRSPHTSLWWRGDRVMKPISVWGRLGGHYGQRPMGQFGLDAEVTPLLFSKDILGFLQYNYKILQYNYKVIISSLINISMSKTGCVYSIIDYTTIFLNDFII